MTRWKRNSSSEGEMISCSLVRQISSHPWPPHLFRFEAELKYPTEKLKLIVICLSISSNWEGWGHLSEYSAYYTNAIAEMEHIHKFRRSRLCLFASLACSSSCKCSMSTHYLSNILIIIHIAGRIVYRWQFANR